VMEVAGGCWCVAVAADVVQWCPVAGEIGGGGCRGGWKERRKLGLGFWEMKMMTWQPSIGQLVSARIVATWLALVG